MVKLRAPGHGHSQVLSHGQCHVLSSWSWSSVELMVMAKCCSHGQGQTLISWSWSSFELLVLVMVMVKCLGHDYCVDRRFTVQKIFSKCFHNTKLWILALLKENIRLTSTKHCSIMYTRTYLGPFLLNLIS